MKIADLPLHQRPREKLAALGSHNLREAELLALLFQSGYQGKSAVELAERLLRHYSLKELCQLPREKLFTLKGLGPARIASLQAAYEIAKIIAHTEVLSISEPDRLVPLLAHLKNKHQEHLVGIYLNARHEIIHQETVTIGTLDASLIHPREVFAPALHHRCASVIIAHNHPSGDSTPSLADIEVTERLVEVGALLDIPLIDHLIIAKENWQSLRQEQLVEFRGAIQ